MPVLIKISQRQLRSKKRTCRSRHRLGSAADHSPALRTVLEAATCSRHRLASSVSLTVPATALETAPDMIDGLVQSTCEPISGEVLLASIRCRSTPLIH